MFSDEFTSTLCSLSPSNISCQTHRKYCISHFCIIYQLELNIVHCVYVNVVITCKNSFKISLFKVLWDLNLFNYVIKSCEAIGLLGRINHVPKRSYLSELYIIVVYYLYLRLSKTNLFTILVFTGIQYIFCM